MYYPCSENKGADQLCSYCEADLRLCFRLCRLLVSMGRLKWHFLCIFQLLNDTKYLWDEKCLQILAVMEKITQKKKRVTGSQLEEDHVFMDHDAAPSVLGIGEFFS